MTITVPLYTPLFPPKAGWPNGIDPTIPNQVVDWWQGVNVNIYQSSIKTNAPPAALKALWSDPDKLQKAAEFATGDKPRCPDATPCNLYLFTSSDPGKSLAIPQGSDPQQLVEGTLGASSANPDAKDANPSAPIRLFDAGVVDYDVSYVNSAYLPVVMEPFGDKLFGWVGTPATIAAFGDKVASFLKTPKLGQEWPLYKGSDGKQVVGKVPSVLEIMALDIVNDPKASNDGQWLPQKCPDPAPDPPIPCPTHFNPYPPTSAPIKALVAAWKNCQQKGDIDTFCGYINATTKLLLANFDNYVTNYKNKLPNWNCDTSGHPDPHPIDKRHLTDLQILRHLYGWTPFNEFCGAEANLLQNTPGYYDPNNKADPTHGYNVVKGQFDVLQYWKDVLSGDYGVFDPYVAMIHGPTFINSPFAYAYSVDDAVGNVLTNGTGLIIGVGGLANMPNPDHFTPEIHVNFAYKSLSNGNTFDYYGRCTRNPTTPVNPNFSSFSVPVGITTLATNCIFSLKDNKGRIYLLQIAKNKPAAVCFAGKAKCEDGSWVEWTPEISGNPNARAPVQQSCAMNTVQAIRDNWCPLRFAYQKHLHDAADTIEYHVIMGEPISYP